MTETTPKFSCGACGRQLSWKPELAGKRGKCKCGQMIQVPDRPEGEPAEDGNLDLDALAADAERATANLPPTIVEVAPEAPKPKAKAKTVKKATTSGYTPPTVASEHVATEVLIDQRRDVIVPLVLAFVGMGLYAGYSLVHYGLGASALAPITIGMSLIALIEAAFLLAFAFVVAGPLNVSFGDPRTAVGKFIAIAIFSDGVAAWVDGGMAKLTGGFGGGFLGYGVMGLPVAIAIYWTTMTYLFSMDHGDAYMVVAVLSVFYRIARTILMVLLLRAVLSWGGVAGSDVSVPSFGSAPPANPQVDEIDHAKAINALEEARAFAAKTGRQFQSEAYEGWYSAGAKNVWYEVDRDIDGHPTPFRFVIELPKDSTGRAKCFDVAKKFYDDNKMDRTDPNELKDKGDPYLFVPCR